MRIVVLKQAERELKDARRDVKGDIYALFEDLAAGKMLSMPISRPLPSIAKGLHELRLSGSGGEFRVFYVIYVKEAIYVLRAAAKKRAEIDRRTKELLNLRMRSVGL